jgi:hypothetical protein
MYKSIHQFNNLEDLENMSNPGPLYQAFISNRNQNPPQIYIDSEANKLVALYEEKITKQMIYSSEAGYYFYNTKINIFRDIDSEKIDVNKFMLQRIGPRWDERIMRIVGNAIKDHLYEQGYDVWVRYPNDNSPSRNEFEINVSWSTPPKVSST